MSTRTSLSLKQKLEVKVRHTTTNCTQEQLSDWVEAKYGVVVGRSTIGKILKTVLPDEIHHENQKRQRTAQCPDLEKELYALSLHMKAKQQSPT